MAETKDTHVLELKVEQGAAISELEKTRLAMLKLKDEQAALQKAYKAGTITQEEYAKELVRVESVQKRISAQHSDLQKKVTGTGTGFSNLTKALKENTAQLTIAGTNVGALGGAMTKLLSPVGAVVGLVGLLGSAYAKSAAGAKDLEFASNQASFAIQILSNRFGDLISSSEDGEGFLSNLSFGILEATFGRGLAVKSREQALVLEKLQDLQREEVQIRGRVNDRLAENSELMTEISDETKTLQERQTLISTVIGNINTNQREQEEILRRQLTFLEGQRGSVRDIDSLEQRIAEKAAEINKLNAQTEKRKSAIEKFEINILQANQKQLQLEREKTSEQDRQIRIAKIEREQQEARLQFIREQKEVEVNIETKAADAMFMARKSLADKTAALEKDQDQRRKNTVAGEKYMFEETARLANVFAADRREAALQFLAIDTAQAVAHIVEQAEAKRTKGEKTAAYVGGIARIAANIGQAYRLIGRSAPTLVATSTGGADVYETADGKMLTEQQVRRRQTAGANAGTAVSSVSTGVAIGASIGAIGGVPGAIVGGIIGGLVGVGVNVFRSIRNRKGSFSSGGYTGPGDKYDYAGDVHKGEVVWNQQDVASVGGPAFANAMRPTYRSGSYAEGGIVTPVGGSLISDFREAMRGIALEVSVTEINKAQRKVSFKESKITA